MFNQHPGSPFLLPVNNIQIKGRSTKIASILIFLLHFLPFLTNYNYPKNSIGSSSLRKSPHLLQSLVGPPNAASSPFLLAKSNSFLKLPSSVVLHLINTRTLWSFTFLLPPPPSTWNCWQFVQLSRCSTEITITITEQPKNYLRPGPTRRRSSSSRHTRRSPYFVIPAY